MSFCERFLKFLIPIIVLNFTTLNSEILKEGNICYDTSGKKGTCTALTNCDNALDLIDEGMSPTFCIPGTEANFNALVCCEPAEEDEPPQRISVKKCNEYYPDYGTGIIGGKKALARQYKHMALIGFKDDVIKWTCGGTLISDKHILTAAHCIETSSGTPDLVRLGELDISTEIDDADPQDFQVAKAIVYPKYQTSFHYHDIGIIELTTQVNFTEYIKPACLFQSNDTTSVEYAIATGWGHTSFEGTPSKHLMEVNLIVLNYTTCDKYFKNIGIKLPEGIKDNIQICAGGNEGKDTCQGDSGSPLQIKSTLVRANTAYDIVGVTSFGVSCGTANRPAAYTRVFYYLDWIEGIAWPEKKSGGILTFTRRGWWTKYRGSDVTIYWT